MLIIANLSFFMWRDEMYKARYIFGKTGELEKVVLLFDKAHNKVIAKIYPQARRLKNLLERS